MTEDVRKSVPDSSYNRNAKKCSRINENKDELTTSAAE